VLPHLLYADACERAGTFAPCQIIAELEGYEFNGLGNGSSSYRADDHQCFYDVLVLKGKASPSSQFDLLEVADVISRDLVEYPADTEPFDGELAICENSGSDNTVETNTTTPEEFAPADTTNVPPAVDTTPENPVETFIPSDSETTIPPVIPVDTVTVTPSGNSGGGSIGAVTIGLMAVLAKMKLNQSPQADVDAKNLSAKPVTVASLEF